MTFVFKVLRNGRLRYILYTCPNLWWRSCSKCYGMDCFGTYFTHVKPCNDVRVQSATEWTASVHTLQLSKPPNTQVSPSEHPSVCSVRASKRRQRTGSPGSVEASQRLQRHGSCGSVEASKRRSVCSVWFLWGRPSVEASQRLEPAERRSATAPSQTPAPFAHALVNLQKTSPPGCISPNTLQLIKKETQVNKCECRFVRCVFWNIVGISPNISLYRFVFAI